MRLAVISDIHGNLPALERIFLFIDKANVDGIIWCGDYITDILLSHEVLNFIRLKNKKYRNWIVRGNREDYIIDYYNRKISNFDFVDSTGSLLLTYNSLTEDDLKYISSLPLSTVVDIHGCPKIYVSHKLDTSVNYLYSVFGHVHKQCLFFRNDRVYINPGSVGQSCGGVKGAAFALLELVDGKWCSHFYTMDYNFSNVVNHICNSDLSKCKYHWSDIIIKTIMTGHNYVEDYVNGVIDVSKKCGVNVVNMTDIPSKVWDYVYDKINSSENV
jgi:putative phosphoesterase